MAFWTESEIQFLREHYPTQGARWCAEHMPAQRSTLSVKWMAAKLGVAFNGHATHLRVGYSQRPAEHFKTCKECGESKPLTAYDWNTNGKALGGVRRAGNAEFYWVDWQWLSDAGQPIKVFTPDLQAA